MTRPTGWPPGCGVGSLLADACVDFARAAGYSRLVLRTVQGLASARRIYERSGFRLVGEDPEQPLFGVQLVGQHWALELA